MNNKVFGVRLSWSKLLHMTNTQDVLTYLICLLMLQCTWQGYT